jgi:cytochrome c oxidase assembly protein subunit 15
MVASGLEPGMIAVAPIKLTLHLLVASVILSLLVWHAAGLGHRARPKTGRSGRAAVAVLGLVFLQIALGGLVAGSKAGLTYNSWPLMDGRLVPELLALFPVRPFVENFVDSPALVQFQHRMVAYLLVAASAWQAIVLRRSVPGSGEARRASIVAVIALSQMVLGITTLLLVVPLWAGLAHQLLAMALLAAATAHARLSWCARSEIVDPAAVPRSVASAAASRFAE